MTAQRTVNVKLVADTTEYVDAMERAVTVTKELKAITQELLDLGVEKVDLPAALATVTRLAG